MYCAALSISDNERPSPLDIYSLFFISFYIQIYHADIETAETYTALFPYREPHVSPVKILSDASAYCCCFLSTAVRSILHWLCAAYVGQCSAAGSGGTRRLKNRLLWSRDSRSLARALAAVILNADGLHCMAQLDV